MAEQINRYNDMRKDLDKSMTEEANSIVEKLDKQSEQRSIVIYNEEWHKGGHRHRGFTTDGNLLPAFGRTDPHGQPGHGVGAFRFGIRRLQGYRKLPGFIGEFRGHTYAAGLSMKVENVPEFHRRFEAYVETHILPEQTSAILNIDAQIDFKDITHKFHHDLKKFNPFGPDNTKPLFCTQHVYDYGTSKVVGREQEHIKLELVDNKSNNVMNGIAFGQSSQARYIKTKRSFDICYTIEENTHKRGEVQLQIEDIRPSGKE